MKKTFIINNHVDYRLLDSDNKEKASFKGKSCFSTITYEPIVKSIEKVEFIINKSITPFELNEVEEYIKLVNELEFPMYLTSNKDAFIITFILKEYNENRLWLNSALTIARYLSEAPFQSIVYLFLKSNNKNLFERFEVSHNYIKEDFKECPFDYGEHNYYTHENLGNTNHRLKKIKSILGEEKIMNRIKNNIVSFYSNRKVSVNDTWS